MQMIGIHSIEDCLEVLTGLQKHSLEFKIDPSDDTIMNSVARQVFKGTALTDRQYNLMKEKLAKYKDQFESQDVINFDRAIDNLRQPLRHIDRSKYIKIVDHIEDVVIESYKSNYNWIKIRFPFNKKTIVSLESIANKYKKDYVHARGSHEHYFILKEQIVYDLVEMFKDKSFEIEGDLIEYHHKISLIKNKPETYLKCIKDNNIFNIPDDLKDVPIHKLLDRKRRYGIVSLTQDDNEDLVNRIIHREEIEFIAKPSMYNLKSIIEAVYALERFPLLVILEERDCENQIYEIWQEVKNIVSSEQQSVLFRQDGISEFNNFVKNKGLNNWVDKSTKIVYINNNKLPKVLLTAEWKPITALACGSSYMNRYVDIYTKDNCDLILHRTEELSPLRRYSRYYG